MMGAFDHVLLALIGAYAAFAVRRAQNKCGGNCGACRGCKQAK